MVAEDVSFADAAAMAGAKAMAEAGVDASQIGVMINAAVSREYLEPSTAVAVHHQLDLPTSCLNFDLANACLGFVNAIQLAGTMIDSGQADYALIVDAEGSRYTQELTLQRLASDSATAEDFGRSSPPSRWAPVRPRWCWAGAIAIPKVTGSSAASAERAPSTTTCASATSSACGPTPRSCSTPASCSPSTPGGRRSTSSTGRNRLVRRPPDLDGAHPGDGQGAGRRRRARSR